MTIKKFLFVVFVMFVLFAPSSLVFAEAGGLVNTDPVPLQFAPPCIPVKGIAGLDTCGAQLTSTSPLQDYLIRLYQFAVGISGIVAVGMIVWGAIKISFFSESITQKSEGGEMIRNAVTGIALLLGSYLILRTVNPRIVSLGTALSSDTVPQNTTATSSLDFVPPVSCGTSSLIAGPAGSPIGNVKPDDGGNTCMYRKLYVYKDGFHLAKEDADYYDFTLASTDIKPNSVVWVYPYYTKGSDPKATARCLVYAYREPGKTGSTFESLNKNLEPCVLDDKQLPGYAGGPGDADSAVTGTVPEEVKKLAADLLRNRKFLSFDGGGTCKPNGLSSADGVIRTVNDGQVPVVCFSGCTNSATECAPSGGIYPKLALLKSIDAASGVGKNLVVKSLTGGDHATNSKHYSGGAFDMTVSGTPSDWDTVMSVINDSGNGVTAYCEYKINGSTKLCGSCTNEAFSGSASNLHIHAAIGGENIKC